MADGLYVGIEFDGWQNRYERNLVCDVMKVLRDGGAFYGSGKENILRGNVVRDLPPGKSAHAYYIDELGTGILIENNLAVRCEWPLHIHMATKNTVRNNLFLSGGLSKLSFTRSSDLVLERNIVVAGAAISLGTPEGVATWTNNLFFSATGQYQDVPENVRKGDPRLRDAAAGDYRFAADSVAPGLGIAPLSFRNVGPQRDGPTETDHGAVAPGRLAPCRLNQRRSKRKGASPPVATEPVARSIRPTIPADRTACAVPLEPAPQQAEGRKPSGCNRAGCPIHPTNNTSRPDGLRRAA